MPLAGIKDVLRLTSALPRRCRIGRAPTLAIAHCTGGDLLIALTCWPLALVLAGEPAWPVRTQRRVAALTIGFGVFYTISSELLSIVVGGTWAYSDPVPVINTGLSPLLQWVAVPWLALHLARRAVRAHEGSKHDGAKDAPLPGVPERRVFAAFEQAMADGRTDVAEHLLRALEVLMSTRMPEALLDRAYLRIVRPKDP